MARVTVEDCVDKIPNRYELLMVAAQRAKDLAAGAPLTVARDNDKNSVVALREIADETVSIEELQKSLVMGLQKYVEVEEPEEEEMEIMAGKNWLIWTISSPVFCWIPRCPIQCRFTAMMTMCWIWTLPTTAMLICRLMKKTVWKTALIWATISATGWKTKNKNKKILI